MDQLTSKWCSISSPWLHSGHCPSWYDASEKQYFWSAKADVGMEVLLLNNLYPCMGRMGAQKLCILLLKEVWQCKVGRERLTNYQSECPAVLNCFVNIKMLRTKSTKYLFNLYMESAVPNKKNDYIILTISKWMNMPIYKQKIARPS